MEDTPILGVGEASSRTINLLIGEVVKMAGEVAVTVDEATVMVEMVLEIPHKATVIASEAAKMVEVDCDTIVATGQATSDVCRP